MCGCEVLGLMLFALPQSHFHVICVASGVTEFVYFYAEMFVFFLMYCLKATILLKRQNFVSARCSEGLSYFENALFRITNTSLFSTVCHSFWPACQFRSCCLRSAKSEGCVGICLIWSWCCRKLCKSGPLLSSTLSVGFVCSAPFVLLQPWRGISCIQSRQMLETAHHQVFLSNGGSVS